MSKSLDLRLGVKADPIEYRYTYRWLFKLLARENVRHVQLGTFFELYQLPDAWFTQLRREAETHGIQISSIFTTHRELGGFFYNMPEFENVARRNFQRLIEVGALLGADCVGCNPGAVLRDQPHLKKQGIARYLAHMKDLMAYAHERGLKALTIEPMSCLAEPPTLPDEIRSMATELTEYYKATPGTVPARFCTDIAHGYADADKNVVYTHMQLFEATLPWVHELHLKNTDAIFNSTFGFSEEDRVRGIVRVPEVVESLYRHEALLPDPILIGYLEIGGPKLGRDYTDIHLEKQLCLSLDYLKTTFRAHAR